MTTSSFGFCEISEFFVRVGLCNVLPRLGVHLGFQYFIKKEFELQSGEAKSENEISVSKFVLIDFCFFWSHTNKLNKEFQQRRTK